MLWLNPSFPMAHVPSEELPIRCDSFRWLIISSIRIDDSMSRREAALLINLPFNTAALIPHLAHSHHSGDVQGDQCHPQKHTDHCCWSQILPLARSLLMAKGSHSNWNCCLSCYPHQLLLLEVLLHSCPLSVLTHVIWLSNAEMIRQTIRWWFFDVFNKLMRETSFLLGFT